MKRPLLAALLALGACKSSAPYTVPAAALNTDAAGLREILTALAVLTAMGLVFGAVGVVRVRRVMLA